MVDFAKLRAQTPEERTANEERRRRNDDAREAAERQAKIKHTRTITLGEDAEVRFTRTASARS